MTPCPSCSRHLRSADATCPFCGVSRPLPFGRALHAIGGAVTAMVLAACYGSPSGDKPFDDSGHDTSAVDADSDGFTVADDCDDTNADISPAATEICDDTIDNDCDGEIDLEDAEDCPAAR